MIPLSVPDISGNEKKYIQECLDTGWVSSAGSYVTKFEDMVKDYVGAKHAVAVSSGTAALHLSLIVAGVTSTDEIIVPTLTFIAPVNAVRYCQADPVFMDCDATTLGMDMEKLFIFLTTQCIQKKDGFTYNKTTGKRIKAVIPVHIFGHPVDVDRLKEICQQFNIVMIEDASESIGSEYKGRKTGAFGDIGCFSFNGNKIITTGGGGMIVTNNDVFAKRLRHLSTQAKCDDLEYDHDEVGYNYRLTNLQAAMGVGQMERLADYIDIKRQNAQKYRDLFFEQEGIEFLWEQPWSKSNFWFYTIRVQKEVKNELLRHLIQQGIQARPIWKLIHSLPMYKQYQNFCIEKAEEIYCSGINIPCSVGLSEEDIGFVVNNIRKFHSKKLMLI
ncbi:MAG: LegC family aminotransferase [Candidatus Omnitrophica bacterium]|nr:LegC family aminotransferase [Candidatus Omnitrophota bacterium]